MSLPVIVVQVYTRGLEWKEQMPSGIGNGFNSLISWLLVEMSPWLVTTESCYHLRVAWWTVFRSFSRASSETNVLLFWTYSGICNGHLMETSILQILQCHVHCSITWTSEHNWNHKSTILFKILNRVAGTALSSHYSGYLVSGSASQVASRVASKTTLFQALLKKSRKNIGFLFKYLEW